MSSCSNRALLTLQRTLLVFLRAWYHEVGAHSHCSSTETRCHCQIREIAPRGGRHLGSGHFLNVSCDLIEGGGRAKTSCAMVVEPGYKISLHPVWCKTHTHRRRPVLLTIGDYGWPVWSLIVLRY